MGYYEDVYDLICKAFPPEDLGWDDINYCHSNLSVSAMSVIKLSITGKFNVLGTQYSQAYLVLYHEYTHLVNRLWIGEVRFFDELTEALFTWTYPIKVNFFGEDIDDLDSDDKEDKQEVQ